MLDNLPLLVALTVLVAFVIGGLLALRSRRSGGDRDADVPRVPRDLTHEEEMRQLGIIDIRPAQKTARPAAEPSPEAPRVATAPVLPPPPPSLAPEGTRVRRPFFDEEPSTEDALRGGTEHLLQALHFAARAHTIGLLRQEGSHGAYRYIIESLYSRSAFARASGTYTTRTPLVPPGERHAVLHRVGKTALPFDALRYYREDITALRAVLAAPFRAHGRTYVLVLDAKEDDRLDGPRVRDLVEATTRMLALLRPAPDDGAVHPDLTLPDPAETPATTAAGDGGWDDDWPSAEDDALGTPTPVSSPRPAAQTPAAPAPAAAPASKESAASAVAPTPATSSPADAPPDTATEPAPVGPSADEPSTPDPAPGAAIPEPAAVLPRPQAPVARPSRRSILAAELARAGGTGLTLALIDVDDPSVNETNLADAEAILEARVRAVAPGRRVEQFGDLSYGVFINDTSEAVDTWAEQAFLRLQSAFPGTFVSLGAACFVDTSLSPDQARAQAEKALRKSQETGGPVVYGPQPG